MECLMGKFKSSPSS